jgi:hypothetical protein
VSWGSRVAIECNARGEPPPKITFWNEARPVRTQQSIFNGYTIRFVLQSYSHNQQNPIVIAQIFNISFQSEFLFMRNTFLFYSSLN